MPVSVDDILGLIHTLEPPERRELVCRVMLEVADLPLTDDEWARYREEEARRQRVTVALRARRAV